LGVFVNALGLAAERSVSAAATAPQVGPGLGEWLLARLRRRALREPRLALVERISLAPRQIVALVEADGQRLLVATSYDGAPVFFPLKPSAPRPTAKRARTADAEGKSL
jgi:flagellar biogenesis protein FliO